jgi:hypothetical protein
MTRVNVMLLDNGEFFPELKFPSVGGGTIVLPDDFGQRWNVFLLYRVNW